MCGTCAGAALRGPMTQIRVRGGDPERDIAVHGRVMGNGLDHACRVRVQTPALIKLTGGKCITGLTVEEYLG